MATGWAPEGAVQEQIDASIREAVERARHGLATRPSLTHCKACGDAIPGGRQKALPGVRLCVTCQTVRDNQTGTGVRLNRRGSKDSQLR